MRTLCTTATTAHKKLFASISERLVFDKQFLQLTSLTLSVFKRHAAAAVVKLRFASIEVEFVQKRQRHAV